MLWDHRLLLGMPEERQLETRNFAPFFKVLGKESTLSPGIVHSPPLLKEKGNTLEFSLSPSHFFQHTLYKNTEGDLPADLPFQGGSKGQTKI